MSSIGGRDLSGLTATGRPISNHGRKQISKLVRSMLNQPSSKHTHNIQDHTHSGYPSESRPHSVLSERSKSFTEGSASRPLTGGSERNSGNFVANFCQTVLNGANSSSILRGSGRRNSEGVRSEAGDSGDPSGSG